MSSAPTGTNAHANRTRRRVPCKGTMQQRMMGADLNNQHIVPIGAVDMGGGMLSFETERLCILAIVRTLACHDGICAGWLFLNTLTCSRSSVIWFKQVALAASCTRSCSLKVVRTF